MIQYQFDRAFGAPYRYLPTCREMLLELIAQKPTDSEQITVTTIQIPSWIDTWVLLRNLEADGELKRELYVLKSRGMAHSNQVRLFRFTPRGIELFDKEK